MKFIHIADLHIGKILNGYSLLDDQRYILDEVIRIMKEEDCSNLIIAGDIYDRSIPSSEAVKLFNDFLDKVINDEQFKVYMISGNHDSSERLNFGSNILNKRGLFIDSFVSVPLNKYTLNDEYGNINIYMLPFVSYQSVRNNYGVDVHNNCEAIKYLLDETKINNKERNIIIAHDTIGYEGKLIRSDSELGQSIGGLEMIDSSIFKGFNYVALGHIHTPQALGSDNIRYSGSILKYSESEIYKDKSCVLIDLKDNIEIKEIPLKPLKDVRKLEGFFDELIHNESNNDYLYIHLKDKKVIIDAMAKLRNVYPNALSIKYDNLESNVNKLIKKEGFEEKTILEKFNDFSEYVYDEKLNEEENKIINELLKEQEESCDQ